MSIAVGGRGIRSVVRRVAGRAARSPWMSVAAAAAVLLGTGGTYLSGDIAADVQSCDVRRELMVANGSPELHAYRGAVAKITNAQAYIALAMSTRDLERRREYAYLGIAAANGAISETTLEPGDHLDLLSWPDGRELASFPYMNALAGRIYKLDVTQLVHTFKAHDRHMQDQLSGLAECNREAEVGQSIGVVAVILTLLSVILIAAREFHQNSRKKPPRRPRAVPPG